MNDAIPTDKQLSLLRLLADRESGKDVWVDIQEADRCEELGWIESVGLNRWVLTELGKRFL